MWHTYSMGAGIAPYQSGDEAQMLHLSPISYVLAWNS